MKLFDATKARSFIHRRKIMTRALAHARDRGQALFLWQPAAVDAPRRGELFDQDRSRLVATVQSLGVRDVPVMHPGDARQHVSLTIAVLDIAIAQTAEVSK